MPSLGRLFIHQTSDLGFAAFSVLIQRKPPPPL